MHLLAQHIVIMATLTFKEQNLHALCHIDAQKLVRIAKNCGKGRKQSGFQNGVLGKVSLAKGLRTKVPFDDQCSVETSKYTNNDIEDDFKEMPGSVVADREHDELAGPERIHCLL